LQIVTFILQICTSNPFLLLDKVLFAHASFSSKSQIPQFANGRLFLFCPFPATAQVFQNLLQVVLSSTADVSDKKALRRFPAFEFFSASPVLSQIVPQIQINRFHRLYVFLSQNTDSWPSKQFYPLFVVEANNACVFFCTSRFFQ